MPQGIAGLIAWTKREEWRGALTELLGRQSAQACTRLRIDIEDMADIPGDDATTVLFGAVCEDLVATEASEVATSRTAVFAGVAGERMPPQATTSPACTGRSSVPTKGSGPVPSQSLQWRDLILVAIRRA